MILNSYPLPHINKSAEGHPRKAEQQRGFKIEQAMIKKLSTEEATTRLAELKRPLKKGPS